MASQSRHPSDGDLLTEDATDEESPDEESPDETADQTEAAAEPSTAEEAAQLPLDQVFEILKNERRRTVLHHLKEREETVDLGELAEHVAGIENDKPVSEVTSNERKCVYVGLYQCHLPKMDNMGIVEFNQNRGRIDLGPNAAQLDTYLERSEESARPWPQYYCALSAGGLVSVVGSQLGGAAIGLTATVVASVAFLAIGAVAATHFYETSDD